MGRLASGIVPISEARKLNIWHFQVPLATLAGLLAMGTATVHLAMAPAHLEEWWGYGWLFLLVSSCQVLYGIGLLVPKSPFPGSRRYLIAGVLGSLTVMLGYMVSRTLGVPFLGPHAGHVESVGTPDLVSKVLELALVASLTVLLFRQDTTEGIYRVRTRLTVLFGGFLTLALLLAIVVLAGIRFGADAHDAAHSATPISSAQTLPAFRELLPLLARNGLGPQRALTEVLYAPPIFFHVSGEDLPRASRERSTLVFFVSQHDHDHRRGVAPDPPRTLIRLDGGEAIEPYQVSVLRSGYEERTDQMLFPMPEGMSEATLRRDKRTLTFTIDLGNGEASEFSWQLPLKLPGESATASLPDNAAVLQASALTPLLTQTRAEVQYEGRNGIRLEATYANPAYFAASLPKDAASPYLSDRFTVFLLTEKVHTSDLPGSPPDVVLRLDNQTYQPDLVEEIATSPHHRISLVRFPAEAPTGARHRVMELLLPGDAVMTWHLPISYVSLDSRAGPGVTWVSLLALLGGLIAAMWPCLFQLTVFFIPALGGLSMQEASGSVSFRRRASVVKAALFFVLGFTVVYTTAGALIGSAAGRLGELPGFDVWQQYLGIAGGVVIVLLALRVAAQVRAPLVCKMPVLSRLGHRGRPANPLEMMVAGVAFATGCMTCFGAAIVVAMVVYVGLAGSALVGAFTLFLFSMGMGIPLVIAAIAMAKVMPLLSRFEKAVRWMGLASCLVMVGFAILLITGNYMLLTEWVYRSLPEPALQ